MSFFNYKTTNQAGPYKEETINIPKIITHTILGIIGLILIFGSWTIISAGERGIILRLGEVNRTLEPGFHFKLPIVEQAIDMEVRTQKIEVEASAASKDLQIVTTNIALNYNLDPLTVGTLYEDVGLQFKARIIDPAIQDVVKAVTAKFNAEALITQRTIVKDEIEMAIKERLFRTHLIVTDVSIVAFQFSAEFDKAIEAKVTQEQRALEAENKLKQIEFEAQQRIEQAKGEAEAIRIQAQAITTQGGKDYVQLQAIAKWNGQLPASFVPGSALPFLNLPQY